MGEAVIVDVLATHRLTRLVVDDEVTEPVRQAVLSRSDGFWADLIGCRWCVSVWVGFGVVAARTLAPQVWNPVARALALSTASTLVGRLES